MVEAGACKALHPGSIPGAASKLRAGAWGSWSGGGVVGVRPQAAKDTPSTRLRAVDLYVQREYESIIGLRSHIPGERRLEVVAGAAPLGVHEVVYCDWLKARIDAELANSNDTFSRHWSDPVGVTFRKRRLNDTVFKSTRLHAESLATDDPVYGVVAAESEVLSRSTRTAVVADTEAAIDLMLAAGLVPEWKNLTPDECRPLVRTEAALVAGAIAAIAIAAKAPLVIVDRGSGDAPFFVASNLAADAEHRSYRQATPAELAALATVSVAVVAADTADGALSL